MSVWRHSFKIQLFALLDKHTVDKDIFNLAIVVNCEFSNVYNETNCFANRSIIFCFKSPAMLGTWARAVEDWQGVWQWQQQVEHLSCESLRDSEAHLCCVLPVLSAYLRLSSSPSLLDRSRNCNSCRTPLDNKASNYPLFTLKNKTRL